MKRILLCTIVGFALTIGWGPWQLTVAHGHWTAVIRASVDHISPHQRLIARLGDASFWERQQAFRALQRLGHRAFDDLFRARSSSDPEIARACRRLIHLVDLQPVYTQASTALLDYSQLEFPGRAKKIIQLGRSQQPSACLGLMRIARFELDEVLSRRAAMELILNHDSHSSINALMSGVDELQTSHRTACHWIRSLVETATRPEGFIDQWKPHIEAICADEKALLNHPRLNCQLLRWFGDELNRLGEYKLLDDCCESLVRQVAENPVELVETLDWLRLLGMDEYCCQLAERCEESFEDDTLLMFRMAELHFQNNEPTQSADWAAKAHRRVGSDGLPRIQAALHLQQSGLGRWSEQLLMKVCQDSTSDWSTKVQASCLLADQLAEEERVSEAAQALQLAVDQYQAAREKSVVHLIDTDLVSIRARQHLLKGLAAMEEGHYFQAQQELTDGVELEPANVELLIAMRRLPVEDPQWDELTDQLIQLALADYQRQVDEFQNDEVLESSASAWRQRALADVLNRHAWLASNVGLQLDRAEQNARRAVEIAPSNSAFLDTLAHCLYQQGRFQRAVAMQRQAVSLQPFSLPLRSALSRYRQAVMFAEIPSEFR